MLLAAALALLTGLAQDSTKEEERLFAQIQDFAANGRTAERTQALRAFIEKFPKSEHLEEALHALAEIHDSQITGHDEARRLYGLLAEKFPQSQGYWHWRLRIAELWEVDQKIPEALAALRPVALQKTDRYSRDHATQLIWRLQDKELSPSGQQTYTVGTEPAFHVNHRNMSEVKYRIYRIEYAAFLPHLNDLNYRGFEEAIDEIPDDRRTLVKEWVEKYATPSQNLEDAMTIPVRESGVYLLEGEHDGLTVQAMTQIGRYGLITKAAAGKLLCFVQDRTTTRPVEDVEIRVLNDERPFLGRTDAQGLFVTAGFKGGIVVGLKDGEIFLADSWYQEPAPDDILPKVYIATDRPIYRPGHEVRIRIVHREELGRELRLTPGRRLVVRILDPRHNLLRQETLTLGEFGTAETAFTLAESPTLGEYSITVQKEGEEANSSPFGNRETQQGHFRVDEYRKPEFKVGVTFDAPLTIQGGKVKGKIHADYYFGGPAVQANVRYRVFRADASWWAWAWPYYYGWYSGNLNNEGEELFELHEPGYFGDEVASGEGVTDKDGTVAFEFDAKRAENDGLYTVVADVVDFSRRMVRGLASTRAPRAEFSLSVMTGRMVYGPGEAVDVKVRATTPDGKPVAGVQITLRSQDSRWDDAGANTRKLLSESTGRTDDRGVAMFNVTPDVTVGYLELEAVAQDARGNKTQDLAWAWLSASELWAGPVNEASLEIVPDKKLYEIGDTAHVLVQSRAKNITVLVTLDAEEIHHRQVVTIKGHSQLVDLPLVAPALAPTALVTVSSIRENELLFAAKRLVVNPERRFVKVEITPDKEEYRPRQKARYEIRTTGADGRPAPAEVAIAVIDDSIYALQDEYEQDIRKFFVPSRTSDVVSSMSLHPWTHGGRRSWGGPLTGATFALAEEAKAEDPMPLAPTEIRTRFVDTMLWKVVRTDADGRAAVEVDVPDNLTTWRATARAVTADTRFGQERRSVLSRKNVIVRVETPRFLTTGDQSTLTAVVHNDLPTEQELRIEFAATGVATKGEAVQMVKIPAGGRKRFDWPAVATERGEAKVMVKALGAVESDAMEVTVPVRPRGLPRTESRAGVVGARTVEKVTVPAGAMAGSAELVVTVSPVHASMVLDALDSLAGYPHGCTEQTMSRFLPTVVVAGTLRKLGIPKPALEKELPKMIASGLQRLYSFQHDDGGWGWWTQDRTNPWMTAYVVSGLGMAREAGVEVAEQAWHRGLEAARDLLLNAGQGPDLQAWLLYALSRGGPLTAEDRVELDRLEGRLEELKPGALALLAMAAARAEKDAAPILAALSRHFRESGAGTIVERGKGYGWLDDPVEAAAAALRAFLAADPKNPVIPKLVHGLGLKRVGNWWTSTRQTTMAVFGLSEYLARTGELNAAGTVTLTLNGRQLYAERVTKETWASFPGVRTISGADLRAGENEIEIEKTGKLSPTYAVELRWLAPAEGVAASKGGLRIERTYSQIEMKDGERVLRPLPDGFTAASGQEIEVTLTFTADADQEWLMVEDPIPAGFEPVREYWGYWGWEWSYWYSAKEFHDDRVSISMSLLEAGVQTASYTMRAETPGDYRVGPARAFNMYFPDVGGHSAGSRIRIRD